MFRRRVAVFLSLLATKWNCFDLVTFEAEESMMVLEGVEMDTVRGVSLAGVMMRLLSEDNEELDCVEGDLVRMGVLVGICSTGV